MIKRNIILVIMFVPISLSAQTNLVPNPGFENYSSCPQFPPDGNIDKAYPWFQPSIVFNSSDFFHVCDTIDIFMSVPNNFNGSQFPHTGSGYAGIACLFPPIPNDLGREFLEIELMDSLIAGFNYNVSFYVSLGDTSQYACNNIGIYFSDSIILYDPFLTSILNLYTFHLVSSNIVNNSQGWQLISGTYIATGGEKFILVGNIKPDSATVYQLTGFGSRPMAYYYFDDFNVSLDSTSSIDELNVGDVIISPNPSADVFTISTVHGLSLNGNIAITNLQGQQVMSADIRNDKQFTIDLKNFANGVYLLKMQLREGIFIRKLVKM